MALPRVKVSSKNQIALPASVRRELGIRSGDELLVHVTDGHVLLMPKPKTPDGWTKRLAGWHKEIWQGVDAREYVRAEREAWDAGKTWNR